MNIIVGSIILFIKNKKNKILQGSFKSNECVMTKTQCSTQQVSVQCDVTKSLSVSCCATIRNNNYYKS